MHMPRNAVSIICTDRRRSLDFYQQAFGATLLAGAGDGVLLCPWLQLGDLTIHLLENTDRPCQLEYSEQAMATLLICVEDLQAAFEKATAAGAAVIEPPDEARTTCLIADPDGIPIELTHFDTSPRPFRSET